MVSFFDVTNVYTNEICIRLWKTKLTFSVIVSERYLCVGSKQFLSPGIQKMPFSPPAALKITSRTPSIIISFWTLCFGCSFFSMAASDNFSSFLFLLYFRALDLKFEKCYICMYILQIWYFVPWCTVRTRNGRYVLKTNFNLLPSRKNKSFITRNNFQGATHSWHTVILPDWNLKKWGLCNFAFQHC